MNLVNLVLGGGGAKGLAYIGVVKALEERNILKNIQRFAGNNTGSMVAALLCVGFNLNEVETFMLENMELLYRDLWGISNILNPKDWHPADKIMENMKTAIDLKTMKPKISFEEVYMHYQKELCITATNVGTQELECFDLKTTPKTPICDAISMSIYIPAKLQAVRSTKKYQYVDGEFLCNYPIHCFGETSHLDTLGCLTYSEDALVDLTEMNWQKDTKPSSRSRKDKLDKWYNDCLTYLDTFINLFEGDRNKEFSLEEFEETLKQVLIEENIQNLKYHARLFAEIMYGLDVNAKMIFEDIRKSDKTDYGTSATTIRINTGCICASDFSMEDCDKKFLIKQGKDSTETFLQKQYRS